MLKLIISGCNGHMGRVVAAIAGADPEIDIVAGFDIVATKAEGFPVYADPAEFAGDADVVIDFSSPAALEGLLAFGVARKIPLIICTTGHDAGQLEAIKKAAEQVPMFKSGNMSLGINLLADLVRRACAVLGGSFDIEIVERHHRRKVDAPSGTALLLADAAASALEHSPEYIYERNSRRQPRAAHEIGISAIRGGTIVGEHDVIFAGLDEVIELKHSAASRDVFASGAVRAAKYIAAVKNPGLYDMNDVIKAI